MEIYFSDCVIILCKRGRKENTTPSFFLLQAKACFLFEFQALAADRSETEKMQGRGLCWENRETAHPMGLPPAPLHCHCHCQSRT